MKLFLLLATILLSSSCSANSRNLSDENICAIYSKLESEITFYACKAAADNGDGNANYELGLIYSYGINKIEPNEEFARYYLSKASRAGLKKADLELAYINNKDESFILEILFELSSEGDGGASYELFNHYMELEKYTLALKYLSLSSEQKFIDGMYKYALVLFDHNAAHIKLRELQDKSDSKAVSLLKDSAGDGYQQSIYLLIKHYQGTSNSFEELFWSDIYFLMSNEQEYVKDKKVLEKDWPKFKKLVAEKYKKYPILLSYINSENVKGTVILQKYFNSI